MFTFSIHCCFEYTRDHHTASQAIKFVTEVIEALVRCYNVAIRCGMYGGSICICLQFNKCLCKYNKMYNLEMISNKIFTVFLTLLFLLHADSLIIKNTLPDQLIKDPYHCKILYSKPEIRPGFAPFNITSVTCDGMDYHGTKFEFAVCSDKCINPVTKQILPRQMYTVKEVMLTDYIGQNCTKTSIYRPIACKCVKRVKSRRKRRICRKCRRRRKSKRN